MNQNRMSLTVLFEDGRQVPAVLKPADYIAFERQYGIGVAKLATEQRYEWLAYLAWSAVERSGGGLTFDDFVRTIDDIEVENLDPAGPESPLG